MRYLITGGAGFIGSHLADALIARGDSVLLIDDLSTGRLQNIEHILDSEQVEFVEGSVLDEGLLDDCMHAVDSCFHLASAVGVQLVVSRPLSSLRRNIRGNDIVISAAARRCTPLVFASTSEIYGKNSSGALCEESDRVLGSIAKLRWSYANAKAFGEALVYSYVREQRCPMSVVRLFNTVGPRQTGVYGMVVPRFVDAALRGDPLPVHGDGSQSRCFLHVRDAVSAIVRLERSQRAVGQVFNIGSTQSVTILELAERVLQTVQRRKGLAEMLRSTVNGATDDQIELVPYAEAYPGRDFEDIPARQPSVEKLQSVTRWRAKHDLDDILRDVINSRVEALSPVAEEIAVSAIA
jgi:UDP-glucose 4-epimerase